MKFNFLLVFIALAISALLSYGFYTANSNEIFYLLITVGSGISLFLTLSGVLGIKSKVNGFTANIKVVSGIFFVLFLVSNIIFTFTKIAIAPYIIVNGVLVLIYILLLYLIIKSSEN